MPLGSDQEPTTESEPVAEVAPPIWLRATLDDIAGLDFEAPIATSRSADCHDFSDLFRKSAEAAQREEGEAAAASARVFAMLSAVSNLLFKPNDRDEPFGPMMVMGDRRSPIPEDFRGAPVAVLAHAAERATHPVLKARLSDVAWLLERKRHALGRAAVVSYTAIVELIDAGKLKDHLEIDNPVLGFLARDLLRRALAIGRAVGWDGDESLAARRMVSTVRKRAIAAKGSIAVQWFFAMHLDFGVSDPAELATELETFLNQNASEADSHAVIELWRLAARAYRHARNDEGNFRCRTAAAEALVRQAESQGSAMHGSHWLSAAITEYHGIPSTRDRRTALRHKLIDVQAGIADEMTSYSHPIDLREIAANVEKQLGEDRKLIDLLMIFADLGRSPSPEKLVEDAKQAIREHPLSSIFGTSFHDHEGKVTHKSGGGGFGEDGSDDAVRVKIAEHESLRRQVHASGQVEVARRHIVDRYYIGEDTFQSLLQHSPFVPDDVLATYSRGFARFFQGDYTSALYILTPMLENSLRHILKLNGHDVTSFDDAKGTQEDRTISALFQQMRGELEDAFGNAIVTDIENVFLARPGPSLRHSLAHGLLSDGSPHGADAVYACWLIFRLCCIPLFSVHDQIILPS